MASIRSVETKLVVFDTSVVDLPAIEKRDVARWAAEQGIALERPEEAT